MVVTINTNDGIVEIGTDVSEHMTGWSKAIQPEIRTPGEGPYNGTLWLNHHIKF